MIQYLGCSDRLGGAVIGTTSISCCGPPTSSKIVGKRRVVSALDGGRLLVRELSVHLQCRSAA
jgi:hypothetical protein